MNILAPPALRVALLCHVTHHGDESIRTESAGVNPGVLKRLFRDEWEQSLLRRRRGLHLPDKHGRFHDNAEQSDRNPRDRLTIHSCLDVVFCFFVLFFSLDLNRFDKFLHCSDGFHGDRLDVSIVKDRWS